LRRVPEDPERSGHHTHDGPGGAQLACREDGVIEPVTFSLLRFLEREQNNADDWIQEACDDGSASLLNRLSQALSVLAALNPQASRAKWAKARLDNLVNPALKMALSSTEG